MRNTLLALLEQPEATLADASRLLSDPAFRKEVASRVANPHVRSIWWAPDTSGKQLDE